MFFSVNPIKESLIKSIEEFVKNGQIDLSKPLIYTGNWIDMYYEILCLLDIKDIDFDIVWEEDSYIQASLSVYKTKHYSIIFSTEVWTGSHFNLPKIEDIATHLSDVILWANECRKGFGITKEPKWEYYLVNCNGCQVAAQVMSKQDKYCCKSCAVKNNLISRKEEELFWESAWLI